jgi:predicted dehydrogenase
VEGLCDVRLAAAEERREQFFPQARTFSDHRQLLAVDAIEVVDITTHPEVRGPLIRDALAAGKHVLSQKPFVLDLDEGERLIEAADRAGRLLAVNQNGRWSPHFSYVREAVRAGLIGRVAAVHCGVHWDHSWVRGTVFERVKHLILYDFAIHWFDFLCTLIPDAAPLRVYASTTVAREQPIKEPLMGQALVEYADQQASLAFDGYCPEGSWDETYVAGSVGSLRSYGDHHDRQSVELSLPGGAFRPELQGAWFPDGFHGAMGELLCAIEEKRVPSHAARDNLRSLELCFAAIASAVRHEPVRPGAVRRLPTP